MFATIVFIHIHSRTDHLSFFLASQLHLLALCHQTVTRLLPRSTVMTCSRGRSGHHRTTSAPPPSQLRIRTTLISPSRHPFQLHTVKNPNSQLACHISQVCARGRATLPNQARFSTQLRISDRIDSPGFDLVDEWTLMMMTDENIAVHQSLGLLSATAASISKPTGQPLLSLPTSTSFLDRPFSSFLDSPFFTSTSGVPLLLSLELTLIS